MSFRNFSVDYESDSYWLLYQKVSKKIHIHVDETGKWYYHNSDYYHPNIQLPKNKTMYTDDHEDIKKQVQEFQKDLEDILKRVKERILDQTLPKKKSYVRSHRVFDFLDQERKSLLTLRYMKKGDRNRFKLSGPLVRGKLSINGNIDDLRLHLTPQMYACLKLPYQE